ncbi:hypothetical protein KCU85_g9775, partial [Aureobasidium melanogenum]
TAAGIPTWSPTVVLICRSTAYVWQSGRDAQFSADCGRTCMNCFLKIHVFAILGGLSQNVTAICIISISKSPQPLNEGVMSVTQQQVPAASRTQAAKNDGDVLSSATNSGLVSDNNPSLSSRCMTFQTRIDSYTIELDRLEAMNKAIHKEHDKRKQEQQRDRLIDSASPKPDRGSATVREDKHKIVLEKLRQRRRRLTRDLAVMKEKMEKLKTEIEKWVGMDRGQKESKQRLNDQVDKRKQGTLNDGMVDE